MQQAQLQMLAYVALAMLLGGLVGLDREAARKPAGLRTHMLVSGAAALLVLLGHVMVRNYDAKLASLLTSDPIRIIEAVITGVSFLGAGTIIRDPRDGGQVEGLTTAASLLLAAAIG
ncbi:MAG: MgtC/SapB family protein, partial [Acidobacteria bacterium]|nr:MgtC/SapB family protein [Acidobacteriota bacterium]